ncbi:GspH/FimT family protein [Xanthomonas euroxanthea]|uniref:GspH/FimT family protein n=1 Tax=Xanthomonas euroxanthea TaxID=2259622 RepID=UPI003CCD58AE
MRLRLNQSGRSMIEVITALLVIALLAAIATPSFITLRNALATMALMSDLCSHLELTRSAAVTRRTDALMCPLGVDRQCADTYDWSRGWLIYLDPDGNRSPDRDSDIIFSHELKVTDHTRLSTSQGRKQIRYLSTGRTATSNATFHICSGTSLKGRVTLNVSGRVRFSRPTLPTACPF